MMKTDLHTADEVREMSFVGLPLPEPFGELLGTIEPTTSVFVWGLPGGGKTTFSLDLLAAVSTVHGPALYVAGEQSGASRTIQEKIKRLKIKGSDLFISNFAGFAALKADVEREGFRAVALDSTTALDNYTAQGTRDFRRWAEERGIVFIYIAHAYKGLNTYKGPSDLAHLALVVVKCYEDDEGKKIAEVTKNRSAPTPASMPIRMEVAGARKEGKTPSRKPAKKAKGRKPAKKAKGRLPVASKDADFDNACDRLETLLERALATTLDPEASGAAGFDDGLARLEMLLERATK